MCKWTHHVIRELESQSRLISQGYHTHVVGGAFDGLGSDSVGVS